MKQKTSKKSVFQNLIFIRSLYKIIDTLGFSLSTCAPKPSKSYFVLNILKLNDFIFSTKTLCQMFFQTYLKGFKQKKNGYPRQFRSLELVKLQVLD